MSPQDDVHPNHPTEHTSLHPSTNPIPLHPPPQPLSFLSTSHLVGDELVCCISATSLARR